MIIPNNIKILFDSQPLVSFATSSRSGNPNVVPIYWKKIIGRDTVMLIDNYMRTSRKNLQENSKVCITFWNPTTEEGYKLKGTAKHHTSGKPFETGKKYIQSKKPGRIPKGVVILKVKEIYTITPGPDAGKKR
jgi:predicted pyridoxine 5'-phosphate oxidase superfamily flavin-nucleotide-binding protein